MSTPFRRIFTGLLASLILLLGACAPAVSNSGDQLRAVATTSIVGDVVGQVGGEHIELTVLVPTGADPHSFEPSPQDAVALAEADVIFINGLGLEEFMQDLLESAGSDAAVVAVSEGVAPRELGGDHDHEEGEEHEEEADHEGDHDHEEGEEHEEEADHEEAEEHEHEHEGLDPHVWMDPNNVVVWVENIATALSGADPDNAASYQANADAYRAELLALDTWIREQVAQLDLEQRILVTDHDSFGYLAAAYDFEVVGAIIPSFSTGASPSAGELADLVDRIEEHKVPAIFVGTTVNPSLAEQIGNDLGVGVVSLYTGSLSDADGPASSYLDFMRYNIEAIVGALSAAG